MMEMLYRNIKYDFDICCKIKVAKVTFPYFFLIFEKGIK